LESMPALGMDSPSLREEPLDRCRKCGDVFDIPISECDSGLCSRCWTTEHPEIELKYIGIPRRFVESSFENFAGNHMLVDFARGLVQGAPKSVLITGPTGCGKTHLAAAMVRRLVQAGRIHQHNARFVSSVDFLIEAKATFNSSSGESEEGVLMRYERPALLILDDLGAEKQSDWAATLLYALLDRRYRDMKITFITSNMTLEQIEQQLGSRTASRLSEYEIVKIKMPDHRKISVMQEAKIG